MAPWFVAPWFVAPWFMALCARIVSRC
jgi:hypothetical protein